MLSAQQLTSDLLYVFSQQEISAAANIHIATVYRALQGKNVSLTTWQNLNRLHENNYRKIARRKR